MACLPGTTASSSACGVGDAVNSSGTCNPTGAAASPCKSGTAAKSTSANTCTTGTKAECTATNRTACKNGTTAYNPNSSTYGCNTGTTASTSACITGGTVT